MQTALKEYDTIGAIPSTLPLTGTLTLTYGWHNTAGFDRDGSNAGSQTTFNAGLATSNTATINWAVMKYRAGTAPTEATAFTYVSNYLKAVDFTTTTTFTAGDDLKTKLNAITGTAWGPSGEYATKTKAQLIEDYTCLDLKGIIDSFVNIDALLL